MKKIFSLLALLIFCNLKATNSATSFTAITAKKYEIKSGIVTFESVIEMGSMKIAKKQVLYFDDFGAKECEEVYNGDRLEKRTFVKDGFNYSCSVEYGSGAKTKAQGTGVAMKFSVKEAEALKNKDFKKLPNQNIAGKECEGFSIVQGKNPTSFYGWKGITLKTALDGSMKNTLTATKVEENVAIPADKFTVPAGVTMTDMK